MKYWIFIANSGMPMKVEKCDFVPTICPCPGDWLEAWTETALFKQPSKEGPGDNRKFSTKFKPDLHHKDFEVGQKFYVVSVNRQSGEVKFSMELDFDTGSQPAEKK